MSPEQDGNTTMDIEYKIKFSVPQGYDPSVLFKNLPSPIQNGQMMEIYNYKVEPDGFYFVDHLANPGVASLALRRFIDEALRFSDSVQISEL
jgi:hypothetical protein